LSAARAAQEEGWSGPSWRRPAGSAGHASGQGHDGQHTHICVRHSSYGALIRGYAITIPRDAVCGFEGVDEEEALAYLEMAYGAKITSVDELAATPAAAHV
jgi:hypothetical protein